MGLWSRRAKAAGILAAAVLAACGTERDRKAQASLQPTGHVEGQVVRTTNDAVFVRADGRPEPMQLQLPEGVVVSFGEVGLPRGALRTGAVIRAAYADQGGKAIATQVEVVREGGAYMRKGSEWVRGLSPNAGASSAPAYRVPPPWAGPASGPAAVSAGAEHSGGPAGGGIHGPERVPIAPEAGTGDAKGGAPSRDPRLPPAQPGPGPGR